MEVEEDSSILAIHRIRINGRNIDDNDAQKVAETRDGNLAIATQNSKSSRAHRRRRHHHLDSSRHRESKSDFDDLDSRNAVKGDFLEILRAHPKSFKFLDIFFVSDRANEHHFPRSFVTIEESKGFESSKFGLKNCLPIDMNYSRDNCCGQLGNFLTTPKKTKRGRTQISNYTVAPPTFGVRRLFYRVEVTSYVVFYRITGLRQKK